MKVTYFLAALIPAAWAMDSFEDVQERSIENAEFDIEEREIDFDIEEREAEFEEDAFEMNEFEERSVGSVLSGLKAINSAAAKIQSDLNKIPPKKKPTTAQVIQLRNDANAISSAISRTTSAAKGSGKFSKAGSNKIGNFVNKNLVPKVNAIISNFIRHKPGINKAGVGGVVRQQLTRQRGQVGGLGAALKAKATGPFKSKASGIVKRIQASYTRGINAF